MKTCKDTHFVPVLFSIRVIVFFGGKLKLTNVPNFEDRMKWFPLLASACQHVNICNTKF